VFLIFLKRSNRAMTQQYNDTIRVASGKIPWKRDDVVSKIVDFEKSKKKQSQRQFANEQGVSRTTLQYWLSRKASIDASPALIEFLESPIGLAFLHRIIVAAHYIFTKDGIASIHNVSKFISLSGLSPFVASSYSTQQRVSNKMDDAIIEFEEFVKPGLVKNMPSKKISLAEDETFHPQTCAVSMDPVSNYIVVEKYVENREGATWNKIVLQALKGLPIEVIQVTSDEARGLINHTIKGLNARHSSDLFHVLHEIGKGTSGALASAIKREEKEYETAVKQTQKEASLKETYDNRAKRPPGRRPGFEEKIEIAKAKEDQAKSNLEKARQNQETVSNAKAEIGKVYHPYDPETGAKQDAQKVSELLESCFEKINKATTDLSDRCKKRVAKAHRVVKNMVSTIAFFFQYDRFIYGQYWNIR
jgi:transcriptional regulator with XRE-family HTH domain